MHNPITALYPRRSRRVDGGQGETPSSLSCRTERVVPDSLPAPDWIELCRREFCRRYYYQSGYLRPQVEMPDERVGDVRPAL